jgi:hypothetical protein
MDLQLDWTKFIELKDAADQGLIYVLNIGNLPATAGVYVFGRSYANNFEALYIGKGNNVRHRVNGQLNNLKLMKHLKNAKNGKWVIIVGVLHTKPGQKIDKCLKLVERGLIRHFLSEGHDLVNKQGTLIKRHEIVSSGKQPKKIIPSLIYLERA